MTENMDSGENRPPKKIRGIKLNIGFVIFAIIFIYLSISVLANLLKPHVSVCRVESGKIVNSVLYTGIALRDEEAVNASESGYINYYVGEGEKVAGNGKLYLLSAQAPSGEAGNVTADMSDNGNYSQVRDAVSVFGKNYDDSHFSQIYSLKYQLQSLSTEFLSAAKIKDYEANSGDFANGSVVTTPASGIVSYCYDGMEKLTPETINARSFDDAGYEKHQSDPYTYIESGQPAYKIVHSNDWKIAIQVTEEEAVRLDELGSVNIIFAKDNIQTAVDVEILRKEDGIYAVLSVGEYMVRYISDRYIEIEIIFDKAEGLKIPTSALVQKDFYQIPIQYLIEDNKSYEYGFYCEKTNENGEIVADFRTDAVYYQDEEYFYVSTDDFKLGDYIGKVGAAQSGEDNRYRIGATSQLNGVFNVNKGYSQFEIVHVLYQNGDYCIVQKNLNYSVALYDNIILDGASVAEDQIVY